MKLSIAAEDLTKPGAHTTSGALDAGDIAYLLPFPSGRFRAEKGMLQVSGTYKRDLDTGLLTFRTETQKGIAEDGKAVVILSARASATLTGKAADENGKPIRSVLVRLSDLDPKNHYVRSETSYSTDAEGRFTIPLALDGEYYLSVGADGYNTVQPLDPGGFTPKRGETKDVGLITLRKAEGFVSGQVVEEDGKPVVGAVTSVRGAATLLSTVETDAEGRFRISNVVKGETLELCVSPLRVAPDGSRYFNSSQSWYRRGVKAGDKTLKIVLRKNQMGQPLPSDTP